MKLILNINDDVYYKMKVLSNNGMGSDAINYILNAKPLNKILKQIQQDIEDESYCRPYFDHLACDYSTKVVDAEDVIKIINYRMNEEDTK